MPGPGRRFKLGQSGNPNGRPPAAKGLAAALKKATRDGKEVWEFYLSVLRGDKEVSTPLVSLEGLPITDKDGNTVYVPPSLKFRLAAAERLELRLWGKPTEGLPQEAETDEDVSPEELAAFTSEPAEETQ